MFVSRPNATHQKVQALLEQGLIQTEICQRLGISRSVVSRVALRLGRRSRPGRRCRYDWAAIRQYYDNGHTARECRERFGFSSGAWDQAVTRGDIVPRAKPDPVKHSHTTRRQVAKLLRGGKTQAEIARVLELSKGTVAFHVRNLGVPPDERCARRYDWKMVQAAYDEGLTVRECAKRFGFCLASWTQAARRGAVVPRPQKTPLEQLLVVGRTQTNRVHLRNRLVEEGLKENRCERCGIREWMGQPLSLELHHINGNKHDNRLENLKILCGNCHSQTHSWGGRNARHLRVVEGGLSDVG
jgi:DNA-binding CsgD family transcriptional regulator